MKICISALSLDSFGGAERVVISDANYFNREGNEVHVISDAFDKEVLMNYGLDPSIDCHQYSSAKTDWNRLLSFGSQVIKLRKKIKRINPDVVIAHYQEKSTWMALSSLSMDPILAAHVHGSILWFKNSNKRVVHTWKNCVNKIINDVPGHSEFWDVENVSVMNKILVTIEQILETFSLRACDEIFVNNNQIQKELDCLYNVDTSVNPPGVDVSEKYNNFDKDLPDRFVFSVSRLDPRKRIDVLIEAFSALTSKRENVSLIIGGTGEEEPNLRNLVKEHNIEEKVIFEGFIPEDLLHHYYSKAEIFACPGWMSYGLTPLEAIRYQTKVAISTDAYVKELIQSKDGVKVIPPKKSKWTDQLDSLIASDSTPSTDDIPTAEEHATDKLRLLEKKHRLSN